MSSISHDLSIFYTFNNWSHHVCCNPPYSLSSRTSNFFATASFDNLPGVFHHSDFPQPEEKDKNNRSSEARFIFIQIQLCMSNISALGIGRKGCRVDFILPWDQRVVSPLMTFGWEFIPVFFVLELRQ